MKNVRMLFVMALTVGATQIVSGQEQSAREKEQLRRDQLHIAVQEICPMTGEKLGEHGPPIKVTVGKDKEVIFLCCKGCLKQRINPKHWATIHANIAKAQRICPVMKKELPKNPKWAIVKGQIVYVCCPPCIRKITKDAKTYLPKIDELYAASLKARQMREARR